MYCLAYQKAGLYGEKAGLYGRQKYTTGCATPFPEGKSLPLPTQSKSQQPAAPCAPSTLLSPGFAMGEENMGKERSWKC